MFSARAHIQQSAICPRDKKGAPATASGTSKFCALAYRSGSLNALVLMAR